VDAVPRPVKSKRHQRGAVPRSCLHGRTDRRIFPAVFFRRSDQGDFLLWRPRGNCFAGFWSACRCLRSYPHAHLSANRGDRYHENRPGAVSGAALKAMKHWLKIFLSAAKSWSSDNAFKHSAAVSFYTLFSLAPITIIAVAVAGFFFGKETANSALEKQITALVGPASAEAVQSAAKASEMEGTSVISTVIGVALLLFGATTVFGQLQESLNSIWGVKTKPSKSGWLVLIVQRLVSLAMVLTVGFLLLVSLIVTTVLTTLFDHLGGSIFGSEVLFKTADMTVGLGIITVLFALIFKVLPDVRLRWRDVWVAAGVTAALFTIGRYLIALYLGHSTVASIYGAAGSLVALLIWIYYSCAILFYGVEFTKAYRAAGHQRVQPKETAVAVREEVIESPRHKRPVEST
jgi:membrane protein